MDSELENEPVVIPSILHVKASEECDSSALEDIENSKESNKSIAELLDEKTDQE